jgi:hypothetical protein
VGNVEKAGNVERAGNVENSGKFEKWEIWEKVIKFDIRSGRLYMGGKIYKKLGNWEKV